jgi:peptidyl-dipeptidase Dcp
MSAAAPDLARHPLTRWTGPLGLPDFSAIADADFAPVFDAALAAHAAEIAAIAEDVDAATVENTLQALELSGEALDRVSAIFWCRAGAHTNKDIQALEREIAPKMSRHFSAIHMNAALFARIDALYQAREALGLDAETARVLEKTWKRFVKAGAKLDAAGKARLAVINERLASLGAAFGQNVLADEAGWVLYLDAGDDLAGLPAFLTDAMAEAAAARGEAGRYAVTLSRSIVEPFLSFSTRRDLREKVFAAFTKRGENGGETDNGAVVKETLALRAEKARLLGYDSFAALKLDDTMAKTPAAVLGLLEPVWEKARAKAGADRAELQRLATQVGDNAPLTAADWRFWQEKLRIEKYAFDEAELKPYLQLERIIEACFDVASRLFGLTFEERKGIPAWHEDVRVFEVRNADGSHRAVFLADYFNRPSKRSGAWMSALQSAHGLGEGAAPIVYNVMNFAQPPKGQPALLSIDEARTLFHEFGHALHGMLSEARWPSVSGTAVSRDFVELPSQLYEHWLTVPEILERHAVHYRTGEAMPAALVEKMLAARNFDAGFATVEFAASALVDMAYHACAQAPADAFSAFEETGDVFDAGLAQKLRANIYAAGGTKDPEALYRAFRGKMPSPEAMMVKRGLA